MVLLKPLGSAEKGAFQQLLTLDSDGLNILFDVGWDQKLEPEILDALIAEIPQISLILLTHATVSHIGAFAYLRHKYPEFRKIPVYATFPVIRLGQLLTLEVYRSCGICGPFDDVNILKNSEVESIFSEITPINYSQPLQLHKYPALEHLTITAYNSGHSLGGTLWKVNDSIDSVIFAVDWNHARDAHLSGAFLEPKTGRVTKDLQAPSMLITSSTVSQVMSLTKSRASFLEKVKQVLDNDGTVLIPMSLSARMLELILVLDKFISQLKGENSGLKRVPLICCSNYSKQTLYQASSMLEWMVSSIITEWQVQNESPFEAKNITFIQSPSELQSEKLSPATGGRIILAPGECLEQGLSRQVFFEYIAEDEKSALILTEPCFGNTLGFYLLDVTKEKDANSQILSGFTYRSEELLEGEALEKYNKRIEIEKDELELQEAQTKRNKELIDTSASAQNPSDSEDEDEDAVEIIDQHDFIVTDKNNDILFPYVVKRKRKDDYGEAIPASLLKKKKDIKKDAESAENADENYNKDIEMKDEVVEEVVEAPIKIVTKEVNVTLRCKVEFADMNGITNRRSFEMVLKQMKPAKVCAMPGDSSICDWLNTQFEFFEVLDKQVYYPRTNFAVDVRIDANIPLHWHNVSENYSVARVQGILELDSHEKAMRSSAMLIPESQAASNELTDVEMTDTHDNKDAFGRTEDGLTIGDLKLTNLRKELTSLGFKAEFKSQGMLVCNDKVSIQQLNDTEFLLEGEVNTDYYEVRKLMRKYITTL